MIFRDHISAQIRESHLISDGIVQYFFFFIISFFFLFFKNTFNQQTLILKSDFGQFREY